MDEKKIIKKLLDLDQKVDRNHAEIKEEIRDKFDEVLTSQDQIISLVKRGEDERLFTFEYVKRLQKDVDRVKKILKIG